MADELERLFGRRPRGAWLAERVWEPDLPTSLVSSGYQWTVLDDAHFRAAAIPEEALWGPYTTDDQGKVLTVFGTEQGLRYRIPFSEVDDVIGYLRDHATEAGDLRRHDGRRRREVRRLADDLRALLGPDGLGRALLHGARGEPRLADDRDAVGLARRPRARRSRLPADRLVRRDGRMGAARRRGRRVRPRRPRGDGRAARPKLRWLRGAIWRNFQVKYREVNDLHKQMLRRQRPRRRDAGRARPATRPSTTSTPASRTTATGTACSAGSTCRDLRVAALRPTDPRRGPRPGRAGRRRRVRRARRPRPRRARPRPCSSATARSSGSRSTRAAGIGRWDLRAGGHPLAAVMRRRPEAYHEKLRAHERADAARAARRARRPTARDPADRPASIHDIVTTKQAGLSELLHYDRTSGAPGSSGCCRWTRRRAAVADGSASDLVDTLTVPWALAAIGEDRVALRLTVGAVRAPQGDHDRRRPAGPDAEPSTSRRRTSPTRPSTGCSASSSR